MGVSSDANSTLNLFVISFFFSLSLSLSFTLQFPSVVFNISHSLFYLCLSLLLLSLSHPLLSTSLFLSSCERVCVSFVGNIGLRLLQLAILNFNHINFNLRTRLILGLHCFFPNMLTRDHKTLYYIPRLCFWW